jgi:quercetin dioxygenase-like cupin family protein
MTKTLLYVIVMLATASSTSVMAQSGLIFPKGEIAAVNNHSGTVWLKELNQTDSAIDCNIATATFAPGAKLDWHIHPAGQILMITDGTGYYQEKGRQIKVVHKGDVIKCLPGVAHWHGASPESSFTYIAVSTNSEKGKTIWLQRVTDEEYNAQTRNAEQEVINVSKTKWRWMADKNVDSLNALFDEKAVFVHMGGSWGKGPELNVIKTGGIHYKKADIHSVSVNIIGNTAILLNNITLLAVVGGNEVTNPFIVTEVYINENGKWILGSLSFTRLLTPDNNQH